MPPGGMGDGHRPTGSGGLPAHRDLASEVDHPRVAAGRGVDEPPQGLALAERPGIEGGVRRARNAAGFGIEPEVLEAGCRPHVPQNVGRGH